MKELIGEKVRFNAHSGVVVGVRERISFGRRFDGTEYGLEPALRVRIDGEEDLEPVEVHPERVIYERERNS